MNCCLGRAASLSTATRTGGAWCQWRGRYGGRCRFYPTWTASQFLLISLLHICLWSNLTNFGFTQLRRQNAVAKKTCKFIKQRLKQIMLRVHLSGKKRFPTQNFGEKAKKLMLQALLQGFPIMSSYNSQSPP